MMKKWTIAVMAVLLCAAILFFALWIDARNSHEDLEYMCRASAAQCVAALREFENNGVDGSYLKAVAEFRSFMNAYGWLTEGAGKTLNAEICGRVYECLISEQEASRSLCGELLEAMKCLADDINDDNGFVSLTKFADAIEYAGE